MSAAVVAAEVEDEDEVGRRSRQRLARFMLGSGVMHFVLPKPYERLIPARLPGTARFWVYFSGVWELVSGGLLLSTRTKKAGGYATAATIVAVYPGNIKMAIDSGPPKNPAAIGAWLRLPMQLPMISWALKQTRS